MARKNLIIFEGAMCCSTGLCGPEPNKDMIEFVESLKKLENDFEDLDITRASISFNIEMFLENKEISQLVKKNGVGILPITTIDGKIIAKQKYLKYSELRRELEKKRS